MAESEPTIFETQQVSALCESKHSYIKVDAAECPDCGEYELVKCGRCATCRCCGFSLCSR